MILKFVDIVFNCRGHHIQVIEYVIILKSQYLISQLCKEKIFFKVLALFVFMSDTVHFDHQFQFLGEKINNVVANWSLT